MKIKKAVIPAAGLGTRVLPASKSMPKEMIPIVDKPAIQYIVEEAVNSGIEDILIVTSRGKSIVEDHFDISPELNMKLISSKKDKLYQQMLDISNLANISYIRQKEPKGLGHAVMCARSFVGDDPFAVLYGDDVIFGETPVCKQLCDAFNKYNLSCVGINQVSPEDISKYSSVKLSSLTDNHFKITDMVEKPDSNQAFSLYSILGRCILTPKIFDLLDNVLPGHGGEIQLTDAMKQLAISETMIGVDFIGKRYDMGNKLGILQANIQVGLLHDEIGEELKAYLKSIAGDM